MIVSRLLEVFPNCQFFVSTHSPHVLTHVQSEQIFLLKQTEDGIEWSQPDESYGKNVDRVLEDLMELDTTRPTAVSDSIHNIYEMIDKNNLQEAQDQVSEMRSKIGNDPELLKAEVLIKRKERIGK
jgi:predicted ATP-binding protein involved in virulence